MQGRRGQIAVVLAFVLAVIVLLVLLNVDMFIAVRTKNRLQNGGDAAALAAARKQGALINEIGQLNIDHLKAAIANDEAQCEEIVLRQRKVALLGPVQALVLANRAAKKNGMPVRDEFAQILREHINDIRTVYAGGGQDGGPYPEPYPGAWTEYATTIGNAISDGLATGPDNMEFYNGAGGHLLLNRQFYNAVSGKNWCWFHFNCPSLLSDYHNFHDWGPLPVRKQNALGNSEIFSLHLTARKGALTDVFKKEEIKLLMERYGDRMVKDEELEASHVLTNSEQVWFYYDNTAWGPWFRGRALAGDEAGYAFPIVGDIRPEYNVRGCAAICRCVDTVEPTAVDSVANLTWSAAAKPFGTVETLEGETDVVTGLRSFVAPGSQSNVRLVALDSVGGENLATADFGWVNHVRHHLGAYLEHGPVNALGCFYCLQLQAWERLSFRREGAIWLKYNSGNCRRGTGGPSGHGGTSHGH